MADGEFIMLCMILVMVAAPLLAFLMVILGVSL